MKSSSLGDMASKSGRRPAHSSTAREDILRAARDQFARNGFDATTLRAVATQADVDVALIPYYFENKRGLFVAAMELPLDPAMKVRGAAEGPRDQLGERLTRTFLTAWDDEVIGPAIQGVLRSAVTDEASAQMFGGFASDAMLPLLAETCELSDETARVLVSMMFGMATLRYLVAAPVFAKLELEELIAMYAPRAQALIDQNDALAER